MKKFVLILFVMSIPFFNGCNKKELLGTDGATIVDSPEHCYNETKDAGETNVDCGGSCKPCAACTAPCTYPSNTLTEAGQSTPFTNVTFGYNNQYDANTLTAQISYSDQVDIILDVDSLSKMSYPRTYDIVNSYNLIDNQLRGAVAIVITNAGNTYDPSSTAANGYLYVNKVGANLVFEFCDLVVNYSSTYGGSLTKKFSGKIEIPVKY